MARGARFGDWKPHASGLARTISAFGSRTWQRVYRGDALIAAHIVLKGYKIATELGVYARRSVFPIALAIAANQGNAVYAMAEQLADPRFSKFRERVGDTVTMKCRAFRKDLKAPWAAKGGVMQSPVWSCF